MASQSSAAGYQANKWDVTDAFDLIGRKRVQPAAPNPSRDLIALYGLKDLAASVARFDPVTGVKIVRLRKTYSGFPGKLGLAGRNKQVEWKKELGDSFNMLANAPLEDWNATVVANSPLVKGWQGVARGEGFKDKAQLSAKLGRAMTFVPGKLPNQLDSEWGQALGHEKPNPKKPKMAVPAKQPAAERPVIPSGVPSRVATPKPATPATSRPQRKTAGQKRGYDDEVYEMDDLGASDAASSDGGSRNGTRKKRKSDVGGGQPQTGVAYGYGPGGIHR